MKVWMRPLRRRLNGPGRLLEILAVTARQARDHGTTNLGGNAANRFGVGRGRDREPGLDDVHAKQIELTGQQELFRHPERESGRLLAVTQRRVENSNLLGHAEVLPPRAAAQVEGIGPGWIWAYYLLSRRDAERFVKMIIILFES